MKGGAASREQGSGARSHGRWGSTQSLPPTVNRALPHLRPPHAQSLLRSARDRRRSSAPAPRRTTAHLSRFNLGCLAGERRQAERCQRPLQRRETRAETGRKQSRDAAPSRPLWDRSPELQLGPLRPRRRARAGTCAIGDTTACRGYLSAVRHCGGSCTPSKPSDNIGSQTGHARRKPPPRPTQQ